MYNVLSPTQQRYTLQPHCTHAEEVRTSFTFSCAQLLDFVHPKQSSILPLNRYISTLALAPLLEGYSSWNTVLVVPTNGSP